MTRETFFSDRNKHAKRHQSFLTNTSHIVHPHRQSIWTSAVECSRDVEAMMTTAAIIDRTFVDI